MTGIEETIEVATSAEQAYERWSRFDEYPSFVENVERVTRSGDTLRWVGKFGPATREWVSQIVADVPGERIAWVAPEGPIDTDIRFEPLGPERTRVIFRERMHDSALASALAATGLADRRARADLGRFKQLVEREPDVGPVTRTVQTERRTA